MVLVVAIILVIAYLISTLQMSGKACTILLLTLALSPEGRIILPLLFCVVVVQVVIKFYKGEACV